MAALTVYVRGAATATVSRIGDGTYQVYFSGGSGWDPAGHVFTRNCSFQRFDDAFQYVTTASQNTTYELTLRPVIGGNASTSDVDPGPSQARDHGPWSAEPR